MSVTIETVGPCRKRLRVEIPAERVAGTRADLLVEFRKVAAIPGFRPGKAPEPMVEKRYAKEIDTELQQRLIPDTYREALREQKLRTVGLPQIESVTHQPGQPMQYVATVDTAPDFSLPDYKGLALTKKVAPVKDEDVARMLDGMRDQNANFAPVTGRALQTGDFAVVTYSGVADGQPITALTPEMKTLGEQKDFWLLMQSDSFLPGFCDQLLGANPGEKRQVLVNFPADFPEKNLAGRKATYFVDVTGIHEKKLPELNEEFAKQMGAADVAALQKQVRDVLEKNSQHEADGDLRRQVVDQLLGKIEFELPETLVAQETRQVVYDVVREHTMRGATKEQLAQQKDEIFGFAQRSAKDRLRSTFILEAIADAEKIAVEDKEVAERIAAMAQRYRVTPQRMRAQLEERDSLDDVATEIRLAKTLDFLVANATVAPAQ